MRVLNLHVSLMSFPYMYGGEHVCLRVLTAEYVRFQENIR